MEVMDPKITKKMNKIINQLIKKMLDDNLRYVDVYRKAGLSDVTVWNVFNGNRHPKMNTILKIADALGYDLVLKEKQ